MTREEKFEFANRIPFEGLFDKIREVTGMDDLEFERKVVENYNKEPFIKYCSQDIADRVGFLTLMFKHLYIQQFNSGVAYDEGRKRLYYWGTVAFAYEHQPCGTNASTFMSVWYDEVEGWSFRLEKDRA